MNREQKRMMKRQGQDPDEEGAPQRKPDPRTRAVKREPFSPSRFLREVRSELRQVAWPNRAEVINYTTVTFATLIALIALIFILNFAFAKGVVWLFNA